MTWTWNLDPVAFSFMGLEIRWYGLVYVLGFFLALHWGWYLWKKRNTPSNLTKEQFENFCFGTFFSGVLGGRLGEFLFYSPQTFLYDFWEIFKPWHGGMSIHGGLIGALIFAYLWSRKHKVSLLALTDILVIPLALVLAFGRGANFINGELVGRITNQSWGVIFPHIDQQLRHPSQLYEVTKNLILLGILYFGFTQKLWQKKGVLTAIFLIGYGILRFFIEYFREPDGLFGIFTTGQTLCIFMIVSGFILLRKRN